LTSIFNCDTLTRYSTVSLGNKRVRKDPMPASRKDKKTSHWDALVVRCQATRFFVVALLLLWPAACAKVGRFVDSTNRYHTENYQEICDKWTREARVHRGLEVDLIVSATFKSKEFRAAYAREYAAAYQLTSDDAKRLFEDQHQGVPEGHEFFVAIFVPEKKWDEFDKKDSIWKIYFFNDKNDRAVPMEVRRLRGKDAVASHFFPYVTPWKSLYAVRFPHHLPETDLPVIDDDTKTVRLVITGVLGTAEMTWNLQ